MDAEDPLFVLYTSGSTGKPKGVLHSTGGYMVYAATTSKYVFDLQAYRPAFPRRAAVPPSATPSPPACRMATPSSARRTAGGSPATRTSRMGRCSTVRHRRATRRRCGGGRVLLTRRPRLSPQVIFEGVPSYPDNGRLWRIVDEHQVSLYAGGGGGTPQRGTRVPPLLGAAGHSDLHRAHGHSRADALGRRSREGVVAQVAQATRIGGGAHQPRGEQT